ncbi:hypothetical protein [Parablautia muri]|uniref:Uncharacterized protein n=1 Tax=Parablautia muri TaxID=2320879 RepID=A0A9X5BFR8_9FIRM|nr:hypothetical protein [Parablautia muri]NBJ92822.1 hypothetical protein [Parablautia muri]
MGAETVIAFIQSLCQYAGEDEAFAKGFWEQLKEDEEIYQELVYYMEHGNFACKAKIQGYTVVDVMVWQMDHFKARLDRDNSGTRQNGDRMLLLAFDTLLNMRREPEKYIRKMSGETGTDYPDKY